MCFSLLRCLPLGVQRRCHSTADWSYEVNAILRELCFAGRLPEAVALLCRHGGLGVDSKTFALLLQDAIHRKESKLGKRIHAQMITSGFVLDKYIRTKLLIFYAKDGDMQSALRFFDKIPDGTVVSWNAMISGYIRKGLEMEALNLYYSLRLAGLEPDQYTFASVFRACAGLAMLEHGKRAHCVMMKTQIKGNVVINTALIDMYCKCSSSTDARKVFDRSACRNVVTWTALISGYGNNGEALEVIELFNQMIAEGFRPNYVTFLAVLSACSHRCLIDEGWKYFYSMTNNYKIRARGEHYAAIVDMLGRAGRLNEAYKFLKTSSCGDHSVIWGALLGACRIHGNLDLMNLAAGTFFKMQPENVGKYVVLSNAYATCERWQSASNVRRMLATLGMKKEPAWSSVEIRGQVYTFIVRDKSHKDSKKIYEMISALHWAIAKE